MALKIFKKGHNKQLFEDETEAYRVMSRSENNGMVSYLGHFTQTVGQESQHTILLEYADSDLEEHFRRSSPFLPTHILDFWKNMARIASALSELHEFEIKSIKAQKYKGYVIPRSCDW